MSKKELIITYSLLLILLLLLSCSQQSNKLIQFKDRQIDLKPYVEGFPYRGFTPFYEAGKMYYYKQGDKTELLEVSLENSTIDLTEGKVVSTIDFAARNVWGIRFNKSDGKLYWNGDEKNDEVLNLYRFDTATDGLEKLTDVPYIFGWRWNKDKTKIAYVARLGTKEERLGELRILNLKTGEEKAVIKDTPEMRFTWGSPSWQPNGKGVVLTALRDADRTFGNIVYIPFEDTPKKAIVLTDIKKPREFPGVMKKWLNENEFIYFSNESGFTNIYRYNIGAKKSMPITLYKEDIKSAELLNIGGEQLLFAVIHRPMENEMLLIHPFSGEVIQRKVVDKNLSVLDDQGNKMLIYTNSAVSPFQIDELIVTKSGFEFFEKISLPEDLQEKTIQSTVERVEFETFDIDKTSGEKRKLHAFLYTPKNPLPDEEQIVMITSFYGGGNYFSQQVQILCEAGIYVFSPSPRGCGGFGREFAALNDKDLGGNEIIDIIYAAKYISERLNIPAERVGCYGGSHGGYATMRLLTFPGEINGNTANFDWGFGISHAGFSDIIRFYNECNIPDWVTLEAGDPATEADKLMDRSPISHADKLMGKLLLTHGENDSRVPVVESRTMADKLKSLGKPVTYIEFKGQGHGVKGLDNTIERYRTWFEFLETIGE